MIRKATSDDLTAIKIIADANKRELGFVTKPALLFGISKGWLLIAEEQGHVVGFVHYRHRRDEQTTIYELCVSQQHRGKGIGRLLIEALSQEAQERGKACIRLKAVAGIAANDFYAHLGFVLIATEQGRKRPLNVWSYRVLPHILW